MNGTRAAGRAVRVTRVAVPVGFLALFFAWPLAAIFGRSLRANALTDVLTDPVFRRVAWFTLWQAVVSTILTVVVGLPAA
jgi:thiamine transport system permease protein